MKIDTLLSKAARFAKKGDYENALGLLRSEEENYSGSFKYYYLYGVICLHSGSFVEALQNFNLARKIKIKDPDTMLGHAVLYLKRMNTVQALNYYLEIQEMDPKNKTAKKALAVIRKYSKGEELSDWMTQKRLVKLYPPIPSPGFDFFTVIRASLIFFAVLIVVFGFLFGFKILESPIKKRDTRPVTEFILSGNERSSPVETGGSYKYILTATQATDIYDKALSLFTSYRDEAAKINLNRILESNASEGLRNRARLMIDNMEIPGFDNFKRNDNPSYADVRTEPVIYRDVYVIWRGMATNVEVTDEFTYFDFLVGYDTRRTLEGIVPVIFLTPVAINPERPLEVLGKIEVLPSSDIRLTGVAIHQSGRLEN